MLAAEAPDLAACLLLLSYPLHPPGRPQELRAAHLPRLRTPAVFVHGTRDPFATSAELQDAVALIPAPTALIEIEGAGHDLSRGRGQARQTHGEIAARALATVRGLVSSREASPPGREWSLPRVPPRP
jgi:predicted alpha/beta-hydrolase family hydrolase